MGTAYGVTGCDAQLDFSDTAKITFGTGTLVADLNDSSGSGVGAVQGTATNQPDRNATKNGLAATTFDGVDNYMSLDSTISVPDAGNYFFFVVKMSGTGSRSIIGGTNGADLQIRVDGSGNLNVLRYDTEDCGSSSGASMDDAAWHVCSVYVSTTERRFRIDSTARGTVTVTTGGSFTKWSKLGSKEGSTEWGSIVLGEVLHFGSDIGTTNRDTIEAALVAKWLLRRAPAAPVWRRSLNLT